MNSTLVYSLNGHLNCCNCGTFYQWDFKRFSKPTHLFISKQKQMPLLTVLIEIDISFTDPMQYPFRPLLESCVTCFQNSLVDSIQWFQFFSSTINNHWVLCRMSFIIYLLLFIHIVSSSTFQMFPILCAYFFNGGFWFVASFKTK